MGRRRYAFDEAKARRYIEERGLDADGNYKPHLTVRDVPSHGRSHRSPSGDANRAVHTLSDGEYNYAVHLRAQGAVVQEQFALDRVETLKAAIDLRLKHPTTLDGTPLPLTVDFRILEPWNGFAARRLTFKYSTDVLTPRDYEVLAIQALCCKRQGEPLEIIDESFYDRFVVRKYEQIAPFRSLEHLVGYDPSLIPAVAKDLGAAISTDADSTILQYCADAACRLQTTKQAIFDVVRHLLAQRVVHAPLTGDRQLPQLQLAEFTVTGSR